MPDIPISPKPSNHSIEEVSPPATATSITHTLVANYKQEGTPYNLHPLIGLINIIRTKYPPVSPISAEMLIALNPSLSATIYTIAYGLATTVCKQMACFFKELQEA
jgi:hypothetical protein